MASATSWALPFPSALVDGRAPSPRLLPSARRCVGRVQSTCALYHRTARNVVAMATGDSVATTRRTTAPSREATEEGSTELPEIIQAVKKAWDKIEDKYAVASLAFAVVIALWASTGVISAIDRLPLVPGVLELVGISYTGWFIYQNLVFKPDREALIEKVKSTYDKVTGSS